MEDGIYASDVLNIEEYHATGRMSSTGLKIMDKGTVADYVHRQPLDSPALATGRYFDTFLFEPKKFNSEFAYYPMAIPLNQDGSPSRSSKEFKAFQTDPKKTYLTQNQREQFEGMRASLLSNKIFAAMLANGVSQTSYLFTDPETGVACQCRTDLVSRGYIIDLKTIDKSPTTSAHPSNVVKSIANYGYDLQSEFYKFGYLMATGEEAKGFIFAFVEKVFPYQVALYELGDKTQLAGIRKYRNALDEYADYLANPERNIGYSQEIQKIDLPSWAL